VREIHELLYPPKDLPPGVLPKAPVTKVYERLQLMRQSSDLMLRIGEMVTPR
jgi:hypothetical protein